MRNIFLIFLICLFLGDALNAADLFMFMDEEANSNYTNIPIEGYKRVSLPVKKPVLEPLFKHSKNGEVYEPMVVTASQRYSMEPNLVRAAIKAEPNFKPQAGSPKGPLGLRQLTPDPVQKMAGANPYNPGENIHRGVRYLNELIHLFNWNLLLAFTAYNVGPGKVMGRNEIPHIRETRNYFQRAMRY